MTKRQHNGNDTIKKRIRGGSRHPAYHSRLPSQPPSQLTLQPLVLTTDQHSGNGCLPPRISCFTLLRNDKKFNELPFFLGCLPITTTLSPILIEVGELVIQLSWKRPPLTTPCHRMVPHPIFPSLLQVPPTTLEVVAIQCCKLRLNLYLTPPTGMTL